LLLAFTGRKLYPDQIPFQRYFEGGSSSVYLWDLEEGGFAGVVLLKKGKWNASFLV
jgi:hypothetical protein